MHINIAIRTPNHQHHAGPWGELIILSHAFPVIPQLVDESVVESLMANHDREWSAILVKRGQGGLNAYLWRSLTSSFDLFYAIDNRTLFVSDSFAGCVVNLPPEARVPSQDAIVDHFLFRTVPGENSFCEKIKRAGHGMRVHVDLTTGRLTKSQFNRYTKRPTIDDEAQSLKLIDEALDRATESHRRKGYGILFSGGVDSTILATYLPENTLSNNTITSPEFNLELDYAKTAAELLGNPFQVNVVEEDDYFRRLEEVIDQLGMPPHHPQTVILSAAFKVQPDHFVTGEFADGLFGGFSPGFSRFGYILGNPAFQKTVGALSILPIERFRSVAETSRALRTPPTEPGSVAFRFAQDPKLSTLERFIPRSDLQRRLNARFEYISQFLDFDFSDVQWHTYLEAGQKTGFFCEDCLSIWRQLASSYGKTIYAPFVTPPMYDLAMSIKTPLRYTDGRITKHLLKKILQRRLPGYPVTQRKLSGIIPFQRYARTGSLKGWQEKYPRPDFIDAQTVEFMHENDRASFWHTIIYSVWMRRIRELKLTPPPLMSLDIRPNAN